MLFQETLTAVMVAENTMVLKFVLTDTSQVLAEREKCQEIEKGIVQKERKGRREMEILKEDFKVGERGLKR